MEKPLLKKVTIQIPEALWLKAKRQALDERTNLRALVLEGLELRLRNPGPAARSREIREQSKALAHLAKRGHLHVPGPAPSSKKGGKR